MFSPDPNSYLLAFARPKLIRLFDFRNLTDVRTITVDPDHRSSRIEFAPDGKTSATEVELKGEDDTEIWGWNVSEGSRVKRYSSPTNKKMHAMKFSPDGKVLVAIGDQDRVASFDVSTGNELNDLPDARAVILPLVLSPDGRTSQCSMASRCSISGIVQSVRIGWRPRIRTAMRFGRCRSSIKLIRSFRWVATRQRGSGIWRRGSRQRLSRGTRLSSPPGSPLEESRQASAGARQERTFRVSAN